MFFVIVPFPDGPGRQERVGSHSTRGLMSLRFFPVLVPFLGARGSNYPPSRPQSVWSGEGTVNGGHTDKGLSFCLRFQGGER